MSKTVTVSVPHQLGQIEARHRIEKGFDQIQKQMAGPAGAAMKWQQRWEGHQLHFEAKSLGMTTTGRIDIAADSLRIDIDLPEIFAMIASKISGKLQKTATKLLEAK